MAAEKGVQLHEFVNGAVEIPFQRTVMWSDSEVVLKQIFDEAKVYGPFVDNRLSKIYAVTKPDEWRYVEGTRNPADLCSRGIRADEVDKWETFHRGPDFLYLPEDQWPVTTVPRHKKAAAVILATHIVPTPPEEPLDGCGYAKLVVNINGWYRKVMRVASIRKIIAFWRQYRRERHQSSDQWTATST